MPLLKYEWIDRKHLGRKSTEKSDCMNRWKRCCIKCFEWSSRVDKHYLRTSLFAIYKVEPFLFAVAQNECLQRWGQKAALLYASVGLEIFLQPQLSLSGGLQVRCKLVLELFLFFLFFSFNIHFYYQYSSVKIKDKIMIPRKKLLQPSFLTLWAKKSKQILQAA